MKFSAAVILVGFSTAAFAAKNLAVPSSERNPVPISKYKTASACKADQGKWQEGLCWFDSANEFERNTPVEILKTDVAGGKTRLHK